jgi:hypothetical protein
LAPTIVLDRSDFSLVDDKITNLFFAAALLLFWDFKLSLFVLGPIYLIGIYFFLSAKKDLDGTTNILARM